MSPRRPLHTPFSLPSHVPTIVYLVCVMLSRLGLVRSRACHNRRPQMQTKWCVPYHPSIHPFKPELDSPFPDKHSIDVSHQESIRHMLVLFARFIKKEAGDTETAAEPFFSFRVLECPWLLKIMPLGFLSQVLELFVRTPHLPLQGSAKLDDTMNKNP